MTDVENLFRELEEAVIARRVGTKHDEARMQYPLTSNTVSSFDEFISRAADYYNYHFQKVHHCGPLTQFDAESQVKDIIQQVYRNYDGDIVSAFKDCTDAVNGGCRSLLDRIADAMKYRHTEQYITSVFDRYIQPNDWAMKVEIIRQFINVYGAYLGSDIEKDQPERYAKDYHTLIRSYIDGRKKTSAHIRRL